MRESAKEVAINLRTSWMLITTMFLKLSVIIILIILSMATHRPKIHQAGNALRAVLGSWEEKDGSLNIIKNIWNLSLSLYNKLV